MKTLLMRAMGAMLITLALAPYAPSIVQAHTSLVESNPREGSMLTTFPQEVELRFTEPLLTIGGEGTNFFTLSSQTGAQLKLGAFTVDGPLLTAEVIEVPTESGEFRIEYRVVAGDGHVIKDQFQFSFDPAGGVESQSDGPSKEESAAGEDGGDRSVLVLAILIVITAAALIALLITSGSKRS